MSYLTLALDAMSGDFGPRNVALAAVQILNKYPNLSLLLVGDTQLIRSHLPKQFQHFSRVQLVEASNVITHDLSFSKALRISEGSSMRVAIELVQSGKAQACISAGNTAALMGLSTLLLKPIKGIERPALVAMLPTQSSRKKASKYTVMLDLGANAETSENMLTQFALMGSIFAQEMLSISSPKVALLNIGKEAAKGKDQIKQVAKILTEDPNLNFTGYVEGNEILLGLSDVIVSDGFSGNIALKAIEGTAYLVISNIKLKMSSSFMLRCLKPFIKKRVRKAFDDLDPNGYNGATLLGLQGVVIKSHGAANSNAFFAAIEQAINIIENDIPNKIAMNLSSMLVKS